MIISEDFPKKLLCSALVEGYALLNAAENKNGIVTDYEIIEINNQFEKITGLTRNRVIGNNLRELVPVMDEHWLDFLEKMPKTEKIVQFEFYLEVTDQYFLISAFKSSKTRTVVFFTEITLQVKAKHAFQLHEILFENAHDIILYLKPNGEIINANKRAIEHYGYTKEELLNMNLLDIRHDSSAAKYEEQMELADAEGTIFECLHVKKDGSSFPVEVSSRSTITDRGLYRIHIIRDITERKESERKILWLAKYDALTGIPNRANFISNLEDEIQRSNRNGIPLALMLFDIDKFKSINDTYGHEAGDLVLCQVANSVHKMLRVTDQIGRLGGDEFVILQTDVKDTKSAVVMAEKIQKITEEPIIYNGIPLDVKISIGISFYPQDATDVNGLLNCADKAMYEVKHNGGNGYQFYSKQL